MTVWMCATCGLEHADTPEPPDIVRDLLGRPAVRPADAVSAGSRWPQVQEGRSAEVAEMEPDLYGITITPKVGIGHRPL